MSDPYYRTGPAAWARKHAEDLGVCIELDYNLEFPGYAHAGKPTIVARPGLDELTFVWLLSCGVVGHKFGFDAVPDLPVRGAPRHGLHLIPGGVR